MKILLLQGANLTYLGKREPEIYGTTTPDELDAMLREHAKEKGFELDIFYTNIEGEAINRIYKAADSGVDGLVMNPRRVYIRRIRAKRLHYGLWAPVCGNTYKQYRQAEHSLCTE